ncbi:hypothetical protein C8F04DRAFT_1391393 [Mycena alexandri]|uniref:F-box domain-containing protein n=1 Tax=Mycena alexandri TaxID=1745969 RepID=A0AAD6XA22_9AGAR|nr:hypothetical protein C8F04DRAFT_1391393 [Mycena alexandri]
MDAHVSAQPAPLSSIDSLPVEVLAYIFVVGTHELMKSHGEQDDKCQTFNADTVKAPLVYASVNRHWRNVALNTPALYTSLCITPEMLREVGNIETLDTTGILSNLTLSQNHLIDILIDARDPDWDFEDESAWFSAKHMRTAMTVLLPFIGRWRSLTILTDVYSPMRAALDLLEEYIEADGAPHLESLRLMRCAYAAHSIDAAPEQLFLSSTSMINGRLKLANLRHLTLRGIPGEWNSLAAFLPEELKTLELSFQPIITQPSVLQLARILSTAPSISHLVLNSAGPARFDPGAAASVTDVIHLPLLKSLTLGYTSAIAALAVLQVLNAPHLHALTLEDANPPAQMVLVDAVPVLMALFAHPMFPSLSNLTLCHVYLSGQTPLVRVERLELVDMALEPLAFECTHELYLRGAVVAFGLPPTASMFQTKAALRALVNGCGVNAPRVVRLYEAPYTLGHQGNVEEFFMAGTKVRMYHRPDPEEYYEDMEVDQVVGELNDPLFDARFG